MRQITVISSPSVSGINALHSKWKAIAGNEDKTIGEFYNFIVQKALFRDKFLTENALVTYNNIKANIVLSELTPS